MVKLVWEPVQVNRGANFLWQQATPRPAGGRGPETATCQGKNCPAVLLHTESDACLCPSPSPSACTHHCSTTLVAIYRCLRVGRARLIHLQGNCQRISEFGKAHTKNRWRRCHGSKEQCRKGKCKREGHFCKGVAVLHCSPLFLILLHVMDAWSLRMRKGKACFWFFFFFLTVS